MDVSIHASFLPSDTLGFEVRNDVGQGTMRWITVGSARQAGITDDEMMAKGTYAITVLAAEDLAGAFERLPARDAEIVQEPTDQPYGVRDCARDPAGNLVRTNEIR